MAARHIAGDAQAAFTGADMSTKLKLMGVDVASIGDAHGKTPHSRSCQYVDERRQVYKKIVISEDGKQLLGAVLIGDAAEYGTLLQMALNGITLPEDPEFLIFPSSDGKAKPGLGVDALPDTAQICSCNNVTKGNLCEAVGNGACTIADLKACTRAGATCGGCVPLVTQVMKAEMARRGLAVNNHLCEHFAYSRQEIYHLVRVGQIKTFEDLLARHGKGMGCDICKPVAASVFASCWNEFVLKKELASLQDSNDYYLGNIQKDGTYSVVPRMPGGEVTPDGLIAVGQVAKKYGLYTKVTGGARVDMFGARVEQLPLIWEELIAAGFESGHAYGKSLRTVKSCVGSTWCRYGVQDSVGLAVELENRYKGLRAPHKIKFGVGLHPQCAEAQGKDIGVIATEKGWNLYICGNGGMKPRHAELFASDLSKQDLVRMIDRGADVLRAHRRPAAAHQHLAREPRRWPGLPQGRAPKRQPGPVRRAGVADAASGGHLPVRMENRGDRPRDTQALSHLRQQRPARRERGVRARARADPPRQHARAPASPTPHPDPAARGLTRPVPHRFKKAPNDRSTLHWTDVCAVEDILPTPACALVGSRHVAVFRTGADRWFAIDNVDPKSGASVLSRGLVGNLGDRVVVASPLYKTTLTCRPANAWSSRSTRFAPTRCRPRKAASAWRWPERRTTQPFRKRSRNRPCPIRPPPCLSPTWCCAPSSRKSTPCATWHTRQSGWTQSGSWFSACNANAGVVHLPGLANPAVCRGAPPGRQRSPAARGKTAAGVQRADGSGAGHLGPDAVAHGLGTARAGISACLALAD